MMGREKGEPQKFIPPDIASHYSNVPTFHHSKNEAKVKATKTPRTLDFA
jgi:hypothetical protein